MDSKVINVYVACAQKKRQLGKAIILDELVPGFAHETIASRFVEWKNRGWIGNVEKLPFEEVYLGGIWGRLRRMSVNQNLQVFAVSAGFGLLKPRTRIPNYDATFSLNVQNSVCGALINNNINGNRRWWNLMVEANRMENQIASIHDSVRLIDGIHLVALPQLYLDAVWDDIENVLNDSAMAKRMIILTTSSSKTDKSSSRVVSIPVGIRADLGGTIGTILPRLALKMVNEIAPDICDIGAIQLFVNKLRKEERLSPKRKRGNNKEISKIIIKIIKDNPSSSGYTSILRKFRADGHACEMKRFKMLFGQISKFLYK